MFREGVLTTAVRDALKEDRKLEIDLDGTAGYGTSFLEEAFGGLVRDDGFDGERLLNLMTLKSDEEPYLKDDIIGYIRDAQKAQGTASDAE
jgi:hypothetical protein